LQKSRNFRAIRIATLSLIVVSLLAVAPVAFASTSARVYAQGQWTLTKTVIAVNVGPHVTTIVANLTKVLSGTIVGTIKAVEVISVYPDHTCSFHYEGVLAGTLGSSSPGTALVNAKGSCLLGVSLVATISFSQGTGGLAGLRGSVQSQSNGTFAVGTYAGLLRI